MGEYPVCDPTDFRSEQWWEKQLFIVPMKDGDRVIKPRAPACLHRPPPDYIIPIKYPPLPALINSSWIHWTNRGIQNQQNLSSFNSGYTKNLYHFDAPFYDQQQLHKLSKIAGVIPLKDRIRNALDIGAGGGSLGLLLHRMYDIITLSLGQTLTS